MAKSITTNFITGIGKHTSKSLGSDIGIDEVMKASKSGVLNEDAFKKINDFTSKTEIALKFINFAGKLTGSLIDNGNNSPTHNRETKIPLLCASQRSENKNNADYLVTKVYLGKTTEKHIKRIQSGPFMETLCKTIASSDCDYQEHEKRKNLWIESGFNEKAHCFLMEDTYFSVKEYLRMYKTEKKYKEDLTFNHKGTKDIYGCVLNTRHVVKLRSRIEFYDMLVKIHLVKIMDINSDVRTLIQEITNNSIQTSYVGSGRIPKDEQVSEPIFNRKNKATLSFNTLPETFLRGTNKFKEHAKIVRSWRRKLTPGSIWEFDLSHYLGNGIHLNYMYDMKNKEHPSGYIFYIECLGDRRASVKNIKTGDVFSGHSPCKLLIEFEKEISYIANQNNEDDLTVTKISKNKTDFEDDSEFFGIFHPDRKTKFHLNYKELNLENKNNNSADYVLEYDTYNFPSNEVRNILKEVKEQFVKHGLNESDANEDDIKLNLDKEPSEKEDLDTDSFTYLRGTNEPKEDS